MRVTGLIPWIQYLNTTDRMERATTGSEFANAMDVSTHSTASSQSPAPPPPPPQPGGGGSAAGAGAGAAADGGAAAPHPSSKGRKPPPQLAKLREANAKYKQLLKLAKERIQEQEGVLDQKTGESRARAGSLPSVVLLASSCAKRSNGRPTTHDLRH